MNSLSSDSRSSVRPLAVASGRVACTRPILASLFAAVLVLGACDGYAAGRIGDVTGVGGGTGSDTGRSVPSFTQVSAGDGHTCATSQTGVAWCWGANASGQLGRGATSTTGRPDTVRAGSTTFRQLSAGGAHTCALDQNGVAYCWGRNVEGQLGTGSTSARLLVPTRVAGSRSWLSISAGASHTCALAENGTPFCWGGNTDGQLGTGTAGNQSSPIQVSGLAEANAITAGDGFSCAVRPTGVAVCWGKAGRLGAAGSSATPRAVDGIATFSSIDAGSRATCAIEPSVLRARCWGDPAAVGSTGAAGTSPSRVTLDVDLSLVSVGGTSACALTSTGLARCWGSNTVGQLGLGSTVTLTESVEPLAVTGDPLYSSISVGGEHACAINQRLETFCWGSNAAGQLGTAARTTPVRTPTRVP
jgi:alpha-tubulin suppressor-like RCC1 family protein